LNAVIDKNGIDKLFAEETSSLVVFEIKLTQLKGDKDMVPLLRIQTQLVRFSLITGV
jgi:hypothetical protein